MSARQIWAGSGRTGRGVRRTSIPSENCEDLFDESLSAFPANGISLKQTSSALWRPHGPLVNDDRWSLICRIAESALFSRSPQVRGFLLFVSSRVLTGRAKEVNEHEIARCVLGRSKDFNPQEDNIVRVQARHLRAKLSAYFETVGSSEPVIVRIPKGSYLPVFEPRDPDPGLSFSTFETIPAAETEPDKPDRRHYTLMSIAALIVTGLAVFLIGIEIRDHSPASAVANPFLMRAFPVKGSNVIVTPDACLTLVGDLFHQRPTLEEYLKSPSAILQEPQPNKIDPAFAMDCSRGIISYDDLGPANALMRVGTLRQTTTTIRHPRHLNIRYFESGNFTLLGNPRANPWYELWTSHLNFVFETDVRIRNTSPQKGESALYSAGVGADRTEFATISLFPNLKESGNILLLAGTGTEALKAITDVVTRSDLPADFAQIAQQARQPNSSVEILVQVHIVSGISSDCKVLSYRVNNSRLSAMSHG